MDYFQLQQARQHHANLINEARNEAREVAPIRPNPSGANSLSRVFGLFKNLFTRRADGAHNATRPA